MAPDGPSGSASRPVETVLIASVVMVLGVLAIGLGSSRLDGPSVRIDSPLRVPAAPVSELSPDWIQLERGPLAPRWPAVLAWTGDELVVWGGTAFHNGQPLADGAAYDPAADDWRQLSPGPLAEQKEVAWVWTGTELIIWSPEGSAAAWAPVDNQWRQIGDWPLRAENKGARPIWTGREIVDLRGAIGLEPSTGRLRPIGTPPGVGDSSGILWTGAEILILEAGVAYDPSIDSWRRLPSIGPTQTSVAGVWTGELAVAVDYLMNSAAYDPAAATWTSLPDVPLRSFGCAPRIHGTGSSVIADLCGGIGLMHTGGSGWTPLGPPGANEGNTVTVAGEGLYAWGDGFYRMNPEVLRGISTPRRLAFGVSLLDLPMNWTLRSARLESPGRIAIEATAPSTATCRALAIHVAGGHGSRVKTPHLYDDWHEDGSHLNWAASDTDMIDLACSDPESAGLVAQHILTP